MKKIAIVTGASSGFGLLISLELAKSDFNVIATMRTLEKGEELLKQAHVLGVKENIFLHELDVTSNQSISKFKTMLENTEHIDLLVNNAGYAGAGFIEEIPIEEYRMQFETNVFGAISVTQAVLPIMRKQRSGKIINMSSISGRIGFPGLSPYIASKYALEGWSESLRLELKPFGIDVVIVEPGSYKTNIWTSGKHISEKSLKEDSPYFDMMKKLEQHIERGATQFGNPDEIASLVVTLALKKKTGLRYMIGKGVRLSVFIKNIVPWRVWEKILLKQLK